MEAREADVSAAVTVTVTVAMMPVMAVAAAMRHCAPAIDGATMAVIANKNAFAIDSTAAGAAVVRVMTRTAVVVVMMAVAGFGSTRGQDREADCHCEKGHELFHMLKSEGWGS